jgi:starch synthase
MGRWYHAYVNILFVIAEMAPLVKVGGVGDVGGSLPRAVRRLGHDVRVALPFYRAIDHDIERERVASANGATIWRAERDGLPLYLLQHEAFERENVYGYDDDDARFLAFCDGLLACFAIRQAEPVEAGWTPDIIHLHDWHTALVASRLAGATHPWSRAATIFTIHNLGYRGDIDKAFAREHGFAPTSFVAPPGVKPAVAYSALAQGVLHAQLVSTVSPTYAREIVQPEQGGTLAPLLSSLGDRLSGILNGIDTEEYNPAADPHLAVQYDAASLDKRVENKTALQHQLGLPLNDAPLIGVVTRLFQQKAPDVALAAVEQVLRDTQFQFVLLGTGAPKYEQLARDLAARHPGHVAVRIAFDYALGQLIYGASDLFLMPSRYEPCGLGQMIAMRYGAVPVVRRTGGLADSVEPYDAANDSGTGFLFDTLTPHALSATLRGALALYKDHTAWRKLQLRAMRRDFSWSNAARRYVELYERAGRVAPANGARSAK